MVFQEKEQPNIILESPEDNTCLSCDQHLWPKKQG